MYQIKKKLILIVMLSFTLILISNNEILSKDFKNKKELNKIEKIKKTATAQNKKDSKKTVLVTEKEAKKIKKGITPIETNSLDAIFNKNIKNRGIPSTITISSNANYTTSYSVAGSICNKINSSKKNRCNIFSMDNGWHEKYKMLASGQIDFLFTSDPIEKIYREKYWNLRSISHMYKIYSFLLSKKKKDIYKFKVASIGVLNNDLLSETLIKEIISEKDKESVIKKKSRFTTVFKKYDSLRLAINDVCNGRLDGFFIVDTYPSEILQSATELCKLNYVDFKYEDVKHIINKNNSSYKWTILLSGEYNNIEKDIGALYTNASIITNNIVSKNKVCLMTKYALEERDNILINDSHPSLAALDIKNLSVNLKYPLHKDVKDCVSENFIMNQ